MKIIEKLFGGLRLTWPKLIIFAVLAGVYTAVMCMIPALKDTSFSDIAVTFEVWILFGILIIMNSTSPLDSALKCFVFFLISQPLVYLVQDVINHSSLFQTYYLHWFYWTLLTFPMGFIGYFMKKGKWWGLLILLPILLLLGSYMYAGYLSQTMFSFPRHLLTTIFCLVTLFLYPFAIFRERRVRIAGITVSAAIAIFFTITTLLNPPVYNTVLAVNEGSLGITFDDTYKAYLADGSYGDLRIIFDKGLEDWMVSAELRKAGQTEFIVEAPDGTKSVFDLSISRHTYDIKKKTVTVNGENSNKGVLQ